MNVKRERKMHYVPPIPFERLHELGGALESEAELSKELRAEIAEALSLLYIMLLSEKDLATPGRRRNEVMRTAAYHVHCLVERHHAYVDSAVAAVLIDGADPKVAEALKKTYRTMKASALGFREYQGVNEVLLARHAARLPATRRKSKSGNK